MEEEVEGEGTEVEECGYESPILFHNWVSFLFPIRLSSGLTWFFTNTALKL